MLLETPPFLSGTGREKGPRARLETPFIGELIFLASSGLRRKVSCPSIITLQKRNSALLSKRNIDASLKRKLRN